MEGFVTAIVDLFPQHLRRGHRKEIFIGVCSIFWFLLGLSMVTEVIKLHHCKYLDVLYRQDCI